MTVIPETITTIPDMYAIIMAGAIINVLCFVALLFAETVMGLIHHD